MVLQQKTAERTKLLSQPLRVAKDAGAGQRTLCRWRACRARGNTPSPREVRDKIERRYANDVVQLNFAESSAGRAEGLRRSDGLVAHG